MPLTLSLVTDAADFAQICSMDHDAWLTPYNPQLKHFRPVLPTREEAIAWTIARNTKELNANDPNNFMIKATDTETHEVVGFAHWGVVDPAVSKDHKTKVEYYPEGSEEREFAEIFVNGLSAFMMNRVPRRHMDLLSLTVHTAHRQRGAGRMLIRWGIDKADELGIETVISSLPSARGAYERSGLGCIEVIPPDPELERKVEQLEREKAEGQVGRGDKWKELLQDDLSGWLMWRPIGRDWQEGDKAPWMS